jgi:hypothetical protein
VDWLIVIEKEETKHENIITPTGGCDVMTNVNLEPEFKLAAKALQVWTDTLSSEEKAWLRHTDAGRRVMWKRYELAFGLTAAIEDRTANNPPNR